MNDLEKRLKELPLAQPSSGLDAKMQAVFASESRQPRLRRILLYTAAAVVLVCVSLAVFIHSSGPVELPPARCVLEIPKDKAWMFTESPQKKTPLFDKHLSEVTVIYVANGNLEN